MGNLLEKILDESEVTPVEPIPQPPPVMPVDPVVPGLTIDPEIKPVMLPEPVDPSFVMGSFETAPKDESGNSLFFIDP